MKISVITVTLNNLEGLKKTADSVLAQTEKDYEYIILDGGSTDGTVDYLNELKIVNGIKKSEPDNGIYNAMNKAVTLAHGDYCIFLNAGDTFCDNEVLRKANAALGEADLYVGHTIEIGEHVLKGMAPDPLTVDYLMRTSIYHQSTFIRRTLLLEHPYNENLKIVSDWEFFFDQWLHGCSYSKLDFFVSNYYLGGYSFIHQDLIGIERKQVIDRLVPARLVEHFKPAEQEQAPHRPISKLEEKIAKAMTMPPVQRDLKILRNAFKALLKDLFCSKKG